MIWIDVCEAHLDAGIRVKLLNYTCGAGPCYILLHATIVRLRSNTASACDQMHATPDASKLAGPYFTKVALQANTLVTDICRHRPNLT